MIPELKSEKFYQEVKDCSKTIAQKWPIEKFARTFTITASNFDREQLKIFNTKNLEHLKKLILPESYLRTNCKCPL